MVPSNEKMTQFIQLVEELTPEEGLLPTALENVRLFRESRPHRLAPQVYESSIIIGAKGRKNLYLDGQCYEQSTNQYVTFLVPMPIECELPEADKNNPLLGLGIGVNKQRMTELILKMEENDLSDTKSLSNTSGIDSTPVTDSLIGTAIRLLETLQHPLEAKLLGANILDEIYFRVLTDQQGASIRTLLQPRGQMRQISKAVEYIQQNLDKLITVEDLADIVHMSTPNFHRRFKEVMHQSPLQYSKSMKLNKARILILGGASASQAAYTVGYNSTGQFSREYKRYFGIVPSATA